MEIYKEKNCPGYINNEIHSSTQNPTEIQIVVTSVLGIDTNKIVCQVKKIGRDFGKKEQGMYARSVDCDEDIIISGQRHLFLGWLFFLLLEKVTLAFSQ
ncbi:226_t:CDS:2, partial [Racocetra persica]